MPRTPAHGRHANAIATQHAQAQCDRDTKGRHSAQAVSERKLAGARHAGRFAAPSAHEAGAFDDAFDDRPGNLGTKGEHARPSSQTAAENAAHAMQNTQAGKESRAWHARHEKPPRHSRRR